MTRLRAIVAMTILAGLLTGCGTMATTPDKLVSQVKNRNNHDTIQQYEVDRSLAQVSSTLKERSEKCLASRVTVSYRDNYAVHTDTSYYTPHISIGRVHTRLTLQQKSSEKEYVIGDDKPGPDGWYILVVDAYRAGPHRTRVEAYSGIINAVWLKAVRDWADGSNLGCPDMTK